MIVSSIRKGHLKGFTLIELLVVIAIIGILSSVVLASLNTARAKGADAAIKSNIDNARAQAELYYDSNGQSYAGVCAAQSSATPGGIATMKSGASAAGSSQVYCLDSATAWVLAANLKTSGSFCADNTGTSTVKSAALSGTPSATSCSSAGY